MGGGWPPFLAACGLGAIFAGLWLGVGEPWEVLADGRHYIAMFHGGLAAAPFGYRILVPAAARLLPWGVQTDFAIITLICLIITTGVVGELATSPGASRFRSFAACLFWGSSFAFAYYSTTQVRVDAPMLLLLALVILLARSRAPAYLLGVLIALGVLAHEFMLVCIPALWLDKLSSGTLTGGAGYRARALVLVTAFGLGCFLIRNLTITTLPGQESYLTSPIVDIAASALKYSGGGEASPSHLRRARPRTSIRAEPPCRESKRCGRDDLRWPVRDHRGGDIPGA